MVADSPDTSNASPKENNRLRRRKVYKDQMWMQRRKTGKYIPIAKDAPEMKILSQPSYIDKHRRRVIFPLDQLDYFAYDIKAGARIMVYVLDNGVNWHHEEFTKDRPGRGAMGHHEWLHWKGNIFGSLLFKYPNQDPDGHGTCVVDRIVGYLYGSAKSANVKLVPTSLHWRGGLASVFARPDSLFKAITTMIEDIETQREAMKKKGGHYFPVVVITFSLDPAQATSTVVDRLERLIKNLVDLDAVIVMSSGNTKEYGITLYPQRFWEKFPSIILVGAVDEKGRLLSYTSGPDICKVFAPGTNRATDGLHCAGIKSPTDYVFEEGTSFSAPTVAGIAAYLLSIDPSLRVPGRAAQLVARLIWQLAYARVLDGPPVVWNGADAVWQDKQAGIIC